MLPLVLTTRHPHLGFHWLLLISQRVNMHFQGVGLCLGLLFITANADFMEDGVEVEDFSENSDDSNVNDEPSSGVRWLRSELYAILSMVIGVTDLSLYMSFSPDSLCLHSG